MNRRSLVNRVLLRLLSLRRGEVQAMQDVHALRNVMRIAVLFAATIVLPALLLSYLAFSSSRNVELTLEAELRTSADGVVEQMYRELSAIFFRFEQVSLERLRVGESPIENLSELSPYLRGAYRFDTSGRLAAPFQGPQAQPEAAEPSTRYRRLMQAGARLLADDDPASAIVQFAAAAEATPKRQLRAQARLAQARALGAAGQERQADELFANLYADYADVRTELGFRVGDLAVLKRGEAALAREPDIGALTLQDLVERLLAERWTIGRLGDAAVARRALARLDGQADPDWLAKARSRLTERSEQLQWSERVREELELFGGTSWGAPGEFRYVSRPESDSLWATVRGEHRYAFSFSRWDLMNDLSVAAARLNDVDEDLQTLLLQPGDPIPADALSSRTLGPWMHDITVVVLPADSERLSAQKAQRRSTRLAIIVLAVLMVGVGVIITARIIGREMEQARMKADFAANVSHELRSPITQIRLKGEALQLDLVFDDDDRQDHYDAIVREAERLSRLVDNILDFSAIERGVKKYSFRPDDLIRVIVSTAESVQGAVDEAGLELEIDMPDDLPPVWLDREAVAQVLINLISNAVKYGADGGWIGVRARVGLEGVDVSVSDRGRGIPDEDIPHIFEDFYRSTDPEVRRKKGTGIGLSIVRYIVEAHGGTIVVESPPNQGTTFTITFPLEPPEGHGDAT